MPIGGFVINIDPTFKEKVLLELEKLEGVEIYGSDSRGNIVAVIDSETSEEMESSVEKISAINGVLTVGLTYLHAEDEVEKI
jgi:nitrate reductase NapAB chaperone NapD